MLTRDDYVEYLEEIKAIEVKMAGSYRMLGDRLADADLKKAFKKLQEDEEKHYFVVQEMESIMRKWGE